MTFEVGCNRVTIEYDAKRLYSYDDNMDLLRVLKNQIHSFNFLNCIVSQTGFFSKDLITISCAVLTVETQIV